MGRLSAIQLARFKGIGEEHNIPLRPITLIFGTNSSGKSTILQSLLLLKQTSQEAEGGQVTLLPKGTLVDLGGFSEFIHRHDTSTSLRIGLICEPPSQPERDTPEPSVANPHRSLIPDGVHFEFSYTGAPASLFVSRLAVCVGGHTEPLLEWKSCDKPEKTDDAFMVGLRGWHRDSRSFPSAFMKPDTVNPTHPVWSETWGRQARDAEFIGSLERRIERLRSQLASMKQSARASSADDKQSKPKTTRRRLQREAVLSEVESEKDFAERCLDVFRHFTADGVCKLLIDSFEGTTLMLSTFLPAGVSSPRAMGTRRFFWHLDFPSSANLPDLFTTTMNATERVREVLDSLVYLGPLREYPERHYIFSGSTPGHVGKSGRFVPDILHKDPAIIERVNKWLESFAIPYEICVAVPSQDSPELRDVFALRLVDRHTKTSVSILDVGFGISQVLPVIVQSLMSENRLLCVEQPEIHLHPALQAELGDLFIDSALGGRGNQLLVETHSEHLILRIMKRMRETAQKRTNGRPPVTPDDISILFVDKDQGSSRIVPVRISKDGTLLDPWPGGFFEEGFRERFS